MDKEEKITGTGTVLQIPCSCYPVSDDHGQALRKKEPSRGYCESRVEETVKFKVEKSPAPPGMAFSRTVNAP